MGLLSPAQQASLGLAMPTTTISTAVVPSKAAPQLAPPALAFLQKAAASLKASKRYTPQQKTAIFKALTLKVAQAPGALVQAKRAAASSSTGGQSTLASIENTANSIVKNPFVQGGLDAVGAALGDPDLGQQVAQGVQVATVAINAAVVVGGALSDGLDAVSHGIDSLLGGGISEAQKAQNLAIFNQVAAIAGSPIAAAAVQVEEKNTGGVSSTRLGVNREREQ